VLDLAYQLYRGAAGFSLLMAGVSMLIAPGAARPRRSLGLFFAALGALFCMSALDPITRLPRDASAPIVVCLIGVLSVSLLGLAVYLFGDERRKGDLRKAAIAVAAVSAALVLAPLLDYPLGWGAAAASIEDGNALPPLHAAADALIYVLPIASCVFAFAIARWSPMDVSARQPDVRTLLGGVAAAGLILLAALIAVAIGSRPLYRGAHALLQTLMLGWYLYAVRHPDALTSIRREIRARHAQRLTLDDQEAAVIGRRLEAATSRVEVVLDDAFSLAALARAVGTPSYRLSRYFNSRLRTTFPAWRNALRIRYVQRRLVERPDLPITAIAIEAGYASKTAFNEQFRRVSGMRPSEYRRRLGRPKKSTVS
jgi:AraC-like DNA-binding protein